MHHALGEGIGVCVFAFLANMLLVDISSLKQGTIVLPYELKTSSLDFAERWA